jgi:carboxypeptidase C (cathepsin A)
MAADFVSVTHNAGASIMSADYAYAQWNFVANLVKVFPSLAHRPLYLTGESYAGRYIVSDFGGMCFESTLA